MSTNSSSAPNPSGELELTEELDSKVALLVTRLKGSVSAIQILAWLRNFEAGDRPAALELLGAMEFITENELLEHMDRCISEWKAKHVIAPDDVILVHPVGEYAKSGTLMSYYLRKSPAFETLKKEHKVAMLPTEQNLNHFLKNDKTSRSFHLILYDDFSGSGGTIVKYFRQYYDRVCADGRFQSISLVTPFIMDDARDRMASQFTCLEVFNAEQRHRVFKRRNSPFGGAAITLRNVAYKYGKTIDGNPLGYENSQALIALPYGCPNNTIPIMWASKDGWCPLYPRYAKPRIEASRRFRKESAFLISRARELEGKCLFVSGSHTNQWKTTQFATRTDFTLFSIVRLLRQRRDRPTICQILGITGSDFEITIAEAKRRGILDASSELTAEGAREYSALLSRLRSFRADENDSQPTDEILEVYVPKQFEGKS